MKFAIFICLKRLSFTYLALDVCYEFITLFVCVLIIIFPFPEVRWVFMCILFSFQFLNLFHLGTIVDLIVKCNCMLWEKSYPLLDQIP